jgi:hypothetical protein
LYDIVAPGNDFEMIVCRPEPVPVELENRVSPETKANMESMQVLRSMVEKLANGENMMAGDNERLALRMKTRKTRATLA